MSGAVRYRATYRQAAVPALGSVPVVVFDALTPHPLGVRWALSTLAGAATGALFGWWRGLVKVTPEALVVRRLRTRRIAWPDLYAIEVHTMLGTRYVSVTARHGRTTLPAPADTRFLAPDRDFDAKVETISAAWLRHRGADWQRPPPVWGWPPSGP